MDRPRSSIRRPGSPHGSRISPVSTTGWTVAVVYFQDAFSPDADLARGAWFQIVGVVIIRRRTAGMDGEHPPARWEGGLALDQFLDDHGWRCSPVSSASGRFQRRFPPFDNDQDTVATTKPKPNST